MSDEEKGIYVSWNSHLSLQVTELLRAEVEAQTRTWIKSPKGKEVIQRMVQKTIEDKINSCFAYHVHDNPEYKRFQKIVIDATMKALVESVSKEARDE